MNNYHKYLSVTEKEENWGLYVTTAGYKKTDPGEEYPANKEHLPTHAFTWDKGRILDGYYLIFLINGKGVFESALTQPAIVSEGTCFFLFPGVWHRYKPDSKSGWEEYWIGFKGSYANMLMNKNFFKANTPVIYTGLNENLLELFQKLFERIRSANAGYPQIISGIILQLLALVHTISTTRNQADKESHLISKAKFLMQENIEKPLDIKSIVKKLPMGYSKFRKTFKIITGQSPNQYYLNLRLNKAKELLDSTHLNINEIASQVGFDSVFYFSKLFKKKNKVSPKFYRVK